MSINNKYLQGAAYNKLKYLFSEDNVADLYQTIIQDKGFENLSKYQTKSLISQKLKEGLDPFFYDTLQFFKYFKPILFIVLALLPTLIAVIPCFVEVNVIFMYNRAVSSLFILLYLIFLPWTALSIAGLSNKKNKPERRNIYFFEFNRAGVLVLACELLLFVFTCLFIKYSLDHMYQGGMENFGSLYLSHMLYFLTAAIGVASIFWIILSFLTDNASKLNLFISFSMCGTVIGLFSLRSYFYPINFGAYTVSYIEILSSIFVPYIVSIAYCYITYLTLFSAKHKKRAELNV